MTTKNQALITKRTDELAASLNIADQLAGMSTLQSLVYRTAQNRTWTLTKAQPVTFGN